jgi:hypothetical protein
MRSDPLGGERQMRQIRVFGLVVGLLCGIEWLVAGHTVAAQGYSLLNETPEVIETWGLDGYGGLAEIRAAKSLVTSGSEVGRGALRLLDTIDDRVLELGYYEYGAGLFTPSLFEAWTNGFSVRSFDGLTEPFLDVRDRRDLSDIRLRHDGTKGIIETSGANPGGIRIGGNGPNIFSTTIGTVLVMDNSGNVGVGTSSKSPFGAGGSGVVAIAEAKRAPASNPSGGGVLYVEGGALKYRGPSGTVTILGKP